MASNTTLEAIFAIRSAQVSDDASMNRALSRIGMLLRAEMILNATRMGIVDTGNLRASIRYELREIEGGMSVAVGPFGVPYARVIEYGFNGPQVIRAHLREIRQAFGKSLEEPRTVQVRTHTRNVVREGRPFMRRALATHKERIVQILMEEMEVA